MVIKISIPFVGTIFFFNNIFQVYVNVKVSAYFKR